MKVALEVQWEGEVEFLVAPSGQLARQIEEGAPLDLILTADEEWTTKLHEKRLVGEPVMISKARLALWFPTAAKDQEASAALRDARVIAIANPDLAPFGKAAKAWLAEEGLLADLEPRLVYPESVAQVLQFGESGNADACFLPLPMVLTTGIKFSLPPVLAQTAALVVSTDQPAEAREFLQRFRTAEVQRALQDLGYEAAP
jgi:molybdate transport system substrate-binding protein